MKIKTGLQIYKDYDDMSSIEFDKWTKTKFVEVDEAKKELIVIVSDIIQKFGFDDQIGNAINYVEKKYFKKV